MMQTEQRFECETCGRVVHPATYRAQCPRCGRGLRSVRQRLRTDRKTPEFLRFGDD